MSLGYYPLTQEKPLGPFTQYIYRTNVLDIVPILHIFYDNPNLLNETNSKQYAAFLKLNLEQ